MMAGRAVAPLPGGRLPTGPPPIAIGAGTGKPRQPSPSGFFHRQMLRPAPPRMSGAILARGAGGATPGQRRPSQFVLSSLRIENVRVLDNQAALAGGPAAPPGPLTECDWGRDGQPTPACPSIMFHRPVLRPAPLRMARAIVCRGLGGATPGEHPAEHG
jgi:hypothetical protein